MSNMSEELEERLEGYEKEGAKLTGKIAAKLGGFIFAYVIAKPTSKALSALINKTVDGTKKSETSIKSLSADGSTIKDLEITDANIKAFEPIAKKYGIKYSLKEITAPEENGIKQPPKYMVFFRAKDESVMNAALSEFAEREAAKRQKKDKSKGMTKRKGQRDVKKEINKNKKIIDSRPKNPLNKNKHVER